MLSTTLTVHGGDVGLDSLRFPLSPFNMDPVLATDLVEVLDDQQNVIFQSRCVNDFVFGFLAGVKVGLGAPPLLVLQDGVPVNLTVYCTFSASAPSGATVSAACDSFFVGIGPVGSNGAVSATFTTNGAQVQTIPGPVITVR